MFEHCRTVRVGPSATTSFSTENDGNKHLEADQRQTAKPCDRARLHDVHAVGNREACIADNQLIHVADTRDHRRTSRLKVFLHGLPPPARVEHCMDLLQRGYLWVVFVISRDPAVIRYCFESAAGPL